jgi:ribosome biogenesis protein Tsr3
LPAKNDNAVCLTYRIIVFRWQASSYSAQRRTTEIVLNPVGAGLLAMNDDAIYLTYHVIVLRG